MGKAFTQQEYFRHELEWYSYFYIEGRHKVMVCHNAADPCIIRYYSKEDLDYLISISKWNPYSLPIYQEALKYFPQGGKHEQEVHTAEQQAE